MMQANTNTLKPLHMKGVQKIQVEVKEIIRRNFVISESLMLHLAGIHVSNFGKSLLNKSSKFMRMQDIPAGVNIPCSVYPATYFRNTITCTQSNIAQLSKYRQRWKYPHAHSRGTTHKDASAPITPAIFSHSTFHAFPLQNNLAKVTQ
uniref:Uncharacterized protein n=1 Tax=Rhipicephalus zambeziensis TaxID=60191 RepID=A0A224YAN8_9ACAR